MATSKRINFMATSQRFHPGRRNLTRGDHRHHIVVEDFIFAHVPFSHHEGEGHYLRALEYPYQPWIHSWTQKILRHRNLAHAMSIRANAPRYHLPHQALAMSAVESLTRHGNTVKDDPVAREKVWAILRAQEQEEKEKETQGSGLVSAGHWIWYFGHLYVVFTAIPSLIACLLYHGSYGTGGLIYKSFFSATCVTYAISLIHALGGESPGFYSLLPLQTFQYGCLSFLWIWTWPHAIKILPFALYSSLHVSEFAKNYLSRTGKHTGTIFHGLADNIGPEAANWIAYLDLFMLVQLAFDFILIRKGAVVSLVVFGFFYRIQLMYSAITFNAFMDVYSRVDAQLTKSTVPKAIREPWMRLRNRIEESRSKNSALYAKDAPEDAEDAAK